MAKRRLSRQQQRRIATHQKSRIDEESRQLDNEIKKITARVISHHGRQLLVETDDLTKIQCNIRQNLGDIACGDYVVVEQSREDSGVDPADPQTEPQYDLHYVAVAIKERSNLLLKTGFAGSTKPVAANIGQLLIVTAVQPEPNPYLIDRYLTAAENLPADAVIVINKMDLITSENRRTIENLARLYRNIGYRVICCSVTENTGIISLTEAMSDTTSILVGLSGVGKSSIVKALIPEEEIKIGRISDASGEGKHTTTVSALYHLEDNGIIIDSPGVRDFTPINNSIDEITKGFVDVRKFSGACKFSNCSHHHEPGCALREAVENGELNEQRFRNYLRLIDEFNEDQK